MMASNMILMGEKIVLNQESVTQTAFSSMGFSAVVIGRGMRTVGTFSVNPKNGWFIRDNPIEMDDNWGYHDFGNLPSFTSEHKNHPIGRWDKQEIAVQVIIPVFARAAGRAAAQRSANGGGLGMFFESVERSPMDFGIQHDFSIFFI